MGRKPTNRVLLHVRIQPKVAHVFEVASEKLSKASGRKYDVNAVVNLLGLALVAGKIRIPDISTEELQKELALEKVC